MLPLLRDETAVVPTVFKRSGDGGMALRLDALSASPTTRTLRLRWTVLSPGSLRPAPDSVRFSTRQLTTSGGLGPSAGYHDCQPTAWHAGDTVFTWIPLPTGDATQRVVVQAQSFKRALTTADAGPVTLLAGSYTVTPFLTLPATSSPEAGGSTGIRGSGSPLGLELTISNLSGG
jgi:hypothetical protein